VVLGLAASVVGLHGSSALAGNASLERVIDTSTWDRPSPDPSGISRIGFTNRFVIVDSEVEETSRWEGSNAWITSASMSPVTPWSTRRFTDEPADIAMPTRRLAFIADDGGHRVIRVTPGGDDRFGTWDDVATAFSTTPIGCRDAEGLAYGQRTLFITDGDGRAVCVLGRGSDGKFGTDDDVVDSFSTEPLGLHDPEGVAFLGGDLFIVSRRDDVIVRTAVDGTMIDTYDISSSGIHRPSGIAASVEDGTLVVRVTDRGIDNDARPDENDGRIYIFSLG